MPIPAFDEAGLLPAGVYDCTLDEIEERFGSFRDSDHRPRLFAKLAAYVVEAKLAKVVRFVLVDGSFATATAVPNDIDLIVVVAGGHDFAADLSPAAYNTLSKLRVRKRFGFDLLVARENSLEQNRWTEFFSQVRLAPGRRKGMVRLSL